MKYESTFRAIDQILWNEAGSGGELDTATDLAGELQSLNAAGATLLAQIVNAL